MKYKTVNTLEEEAFRSGSRSSVTAAQPPKNEIVRLSPQSAQAP
jgi:hypothetical protein